jgi:hypothetical protein
LYFGIGIFKKKAILSVKSNKSALESSIIKVKSNFKPFIRSSIKFSSILNDETVYDTWVLVYFKICQFFGLNLQKM